MPASDKQRHVVTGLAAAAGIYAILATLLGRTAVWAETEFETYPFHGGEEPIHWLMPTIFGGGKPEFLLAGPSAIGEDILYEVLEKETGGRVIAGGLSNGTIDDIALGLEYIERVHGPDALPRHLIFGMTARVLANYPRSFGPHREPDAYAPLIATIDKYSPAYRVESRQFGSVLAEKTGSERIVALRNWITKQPARYRAGLFATLESLAVPDPTDTGYRSTLPWFDDLRTPLSGADWRTTVNYVRRYGPGTAARHWLTAYRSAYHHLFMRPYSPEFIESATRNWRIVYDWNPLDEEDMVRYQLSRLRDFLDRHAIELTMIYLPEHPASRRQYAPANYSAYRRLIEEELPDARFVDLWEALPPEQFYDNIHTSYAGSRVVTNRVIDALRGSRERGVAASASNTPERT